MQSVSDNLSFVTFSERIMESEYLETSWKNRLQFLKRRIVYFIREVTSRYGKKKGYSKFLTDEEKRYKLFIYPGKYELYMIIYG